MRTASLEEWVFIGTLPSSLMSSLIRSRDQDSIAFWLMAVALWAAFPFFQFRILAALPRYFSQHPGARRLALVGFACLAVFAGLWVAAAWPSAPQEEPALFFFRTPLWLLAATSVTLFLIWSSRWHHRA
jgi:hypothetical protein